MNHHDVKLNVLPDQKIQAVPDCRRLTLEVGDTLAFSCDDGVTEIQFPEPHVFDTGLYYHGGKPVAIVREGTFSGLCTIVLHTGGVVSSGESADYGVSGVVQKPGGGKGT